MLNHLQQSLETSLRKNQKSLNDQGKVLFELSGVNVDYGDTRALNQVDLKVYKGEILFVSGVSGAGKTTLMKLLSGLATPTSGVMRSNSFHYSQGFFPAVVFQDLRLMGKYDLMTNLMVAYDPDLYRNKKEFEGDLMELARYLGIKDKLNMRACDANGGLKQKVAIMRALLTRPEVLIADEPTSSLDLENSRRIFDLFHLYNNKRGVTVIWSSHNQELIKKFNGRIVHLDQGKLVYSGQACFT